MRYLVSEVPLYIDTLLLDIFNQPHLAASLPHAPPSLALRFREQVIPLSALFEQIIERDRLPRARWARTSGRFATLNPKP